MVEITMVEITMVEINMVEIFTETLNNGIKQIFVTSCYHGNKVMIMNFCFLLLNNYPIKYFSEPILTINNQVPN